MNDHSSSFSHRRLTLARYRELTGRKLSETPELSDDLAEFLLHSFPSIPERDLEESGRIFDYLLDALSRRVREVGIYPVKTREGTPPLEPEQRDLILRYASLLTWHGHVVARSGAPEKAEAIIDAAITWAERADDYLQTSIAGRVKGMVLAEIQNFAGAEATLRRAIVQARRGGDMPEQATVLADLGMLQILRGMTTEALHAVEDGNSLLRHEIKGPEAPRIRALLGLVRGAAYESRGEFSRAIATYRRTLAQTDEKLHPDLQAEIYYRLSRIYFSTGEDGRAVEEGLEASRILDDLGEVTELGFVRIGLATTYQRLGDFPRALDMLEKTEECVSVQGSHLHLEYLLRKGSIFSQQNRHEEAEEALESAIRLARERDQSSFIPTALSLLAELAMKQEDYQLAEERYDTLIESFAHSPEGMLRLKIACAKAILEQGRIDEAEEILESLEQESREYPELYLTLLRHRARLSELKGDFREALRFERESGKTEKGLLLKQIQASTQVTGRSAQLEALELELDAEKERRQKVERQLVAAMVDIDDQRQAISGAIGEIEGLLTRRGENEVETQGIADQLRATLETLNGPDPSETGPAALYDGEESDFFNRLRRHAPDITAKQERLCGLLRAGMGPKDVERIMNLRAEGLKALRKRVRKSLNLRQGQSLEKFLREV